MLAPYLAQASCVPTKAPDCSPRIGGLRARFVFEVVGGLAGSSQSLNWGRACGESGPGGVTVTHVTNQATAQAFANAIEVEWPEAVAVVTPASGGAYRVTVDWDFTQSRARWALFQRISFVFCSTCLA